MSYLDWTPALDVRVPAMNDEHKQLIDLMNRLFDLHAKESDRATIAMALDQLGRYTVKHFSDEEAYMEKVGFSKLAGHKKLHQQLLERFGQYQNEFKTTGELSSGLFNFLRFWLTSHIKAIDTQYTDQALLTKA